MGEAQVSQPRGGSSSLRSRESSSPRECVIEPWEHPANSRAEEGGEDSVQHQRGRKDGSSENAFFWN